MKTPLLWLALLVAASTARAGVPPQDRRLIHRAPSSTRSDTGASRYPDSSVCDFSFLLHAPAGQFGFLRAAADGHFHWRDGRRARFWGVCISRRSVMLSHSEIADVADRLARAGCNAVRFEALDGPGGILSGSPTDSRHLSLPFLDTLDFWLACLKARGIYYYLDLLDFRRFQAGDGVPGAENLPIAARPYAVFDRRLIELQREFAAQLLLHRNPYTGLRPVNDPALIMVELLNEHGLLKYATKLGSLIQPYADEMRLLWNHWLLNRYASPELLRAHWAAALEPLKPDEDPVSGSVKFLPMPSSESHWNSGGVRSARMRDQVAFLIDTQRLYFSSMRSYLRGLGVQCPVTAVVSSGVAPDVWSESRELDCTAENYYADHPAFAGHEWVGKEFIRNTNPAASSGADGVAPSIAVLRWDARPVVIREWDVAWPNRYRAVSIPDMAAYASLQDIDVALLFTYVCGKESEHLEDFSVGSDPTVWGLFGIGALVFDRRLILPAEYQADLVYGAYDLEQWGPFLNQLHRLAWTVRERSVSPGARPPVRGISVYSGRGGWAALPQRSWLAFQRLDAVPPADREKAVQNLVESTQIPLELSPIPGGKFQFDGLVYDRGETKQTETEVAFLLKSVPKGFEPVGVDPNRQFAFGVFQPQKHLLLLPEVTAREALRASLDMLNLEGAHAAHEQVDADRWPSDTRQILRDKGLVTVDAPECCIAAGAFAARKQMHAGALQFSTANEGGAIAAVALDGLPLGRSSRLLLKMVTRAENTGQVVLAAPPGAPGNYYVAASGTAPIVTEGVPSPVGTAVSLGGRAVAEIEMVGGAWEIQRTGSVLKIACDTPGVRIRLFPKRRVTALTRTGGERPVDVADDGSFLYPKGVIFVNAFPCDPLDGGL